MNRGHTAEIENCFCLPLYHWPIRRELNFCVIRGPNHWKEKGLKAVEKRTPKEITLKNSRFIKISGNYGWGLSTLRTFFCM